MALRPPARRRHRRPPGDRLGARRAVRRRRSVRAVHAARSRPRMAARRRRGARRREARAIESRSTAVGAFGEPFRPAPSITRFSRAACAATRARWTSSWSAAGAPRRVRRRDQLGGGRRRRSPRRAGGLPRARARCPPEVRSATRVAIKACRRRLLPISVGKGLLTFLEYHYSGFGAPRAEDILPLLREPGVPGALPAGDTQILGRHAIAVLANYECLAGADRLGRSGSRAPSTDPASSRRPRRSPSAIGCRSWRRCTCRTVRRRSAGCSRASTAPRPCRG